MHLEQRLPVAMVGELVRDGHRVDVRLERLARVSPAARENLHLARQLVDVGHGLHCALRRVPLLRKPPGDIRLPAREPRVNQDVVVDATAMPDRAGRPRHLQQPRRVGIQMVQDGPAGGEGPDHGVANLEVELH